MQQITLIWFVFLGVGQSVVKNQKFAVEFRQFMHIRQFQAPSKCRRRYKHDNVHPANRMKGNYLLTWATVQ